VNAAELLTDLRGRGVALAAVGASLRVSAPAHALTPADRAALSAQKPALLLLLTGESCTRCGAPRAPDNACYCPDCRDAMIARFGPAFGETMWRVSRSLGEKMLAADAAVTACNE
jgi:hypothetical protein